MVLSEWNSGWRKKGLPGTEDRTEALVTEPWYLGLGYASCKGRKISRIEVQTAGW